MEKTWRWFGKKDEITLTMLRQIGVEGIVTALHDVPNGEVWPLETVKEMKEYIESAGLRWSVVESLPVCEAIKYAGPDRDRLITNYIQSLTNLGKAGIKTVCYNFMPVIDWIRTDLNHPWPDGPTSLYFNKTRFAYFDLKILKRKHAEKDYSEKELMEVEKLGSRITGEEELELIDTVFYAGDSLAEFALRQADEYVGATCREVEPLNRGGAVLAGAFPQEAVVEIEPLRVARRQVRIARLDDVGILHGFDGSLCGRCRRCRTPPGAACGQSQQKNR